MTKRLTQTEWEQLDKLLSKHGFGGYYDLLECLKMIISQLNNKIDTTTIKDLHTAINILLGLTTTKT